MTNITLGYPNRIDAATLSGGSFQSTLPLTNLQDRRISKRARSTGVAFTRASTATYVGSTGLIETAVVDALRSSYDPANLGAGPTQLTEDAATNLLIDSENMASNNWSVNSSTVAALLANTTTAPDGSYNAAALVCVDTSSATRRMLPASSYTLTQGEVFTFSVFVKAKNWQYINLFLSTTTTVSSPIAQATFDLTNGTKTLLNGNSCAIKAYPNGWYRISITGVSASATGYRPKISLVPTYAGNPSSSATGVVGAGVYVWGAQLEAGAGPSSYIPSTQTFTSRASSATYWGSDGLLKTATTNTLRSNYNPADLSRPATPLLEPAATNVLLYSEQFDNAAWGKTGATISANSVAAPDGATTADTIVESAATAAHFASQSASLTSGAAVTVSCWVKKLSSNRHFSFIFDNSALFGGSFPYASYNLDTGAVSTVAVGVASIQAFPNGWFRCIFTVTPSSSGSSGCQFRMQDATTLTSPVSQYAGNGTSGVYLWGAQLETGYAASSYIAATSATVTRAADVYTSAQTTRAEDITSASFNIALDQARPVGAVALVGHNLTSAAKLRVRGGTSAATTGSEYDSGWVNAWADVAGAAEHALYYPGLALVLPSSVQTYRYWRVEVDDTTNPAGYVEIGRVFLGNTWTVANNASFNWSFAIEDGSGVEESLGKAEFYDEQPKFRVMRFGLDYLTSSEMTGNAIPLLRSQGVTGEVLLVWDSADTAALTHYSFLGRMRSLSALENPDPLRYTTAFEIKELVA